MLARGAADDLVRLLLDRYYDPLYRHSQREKGVRRALRRDRSGPSAARSRLGSRVARVGRERSARAESASKPDPSR